MTFSKRPAKGNQLENFISTIYIGEWPHKPYSKALGLDLNWRDEALFFFLDKEETNVTDVKDKLREALKVDLPQDFFDFWEFCKTIKSDNPCGKFKIYLLTLMLKILAYTLLN